MVMIQKVITKMVFTRLCTKMQQALYVIMQQALYVIMQHIQSKSLT